MKVLDKSMMSNLSFPDFCVKKLDFSLKKKNLKLFVEGAWLDIDGGEQLGRGILFFDGWSSLTIKRFNPISESWSHLPNTELESLKDICEFKSIDSTFYIYGFGKQTGYWIEWKICNSKSHAEFA
jgi:hypothetical protein